MKHRLDRFPGTDGHAGSPRLRIELVGSHEIFRFLVNLLGAQVEFGHAAALKIRALRRQVGPTRFDPWAHDLLGSHRYNQLCGRWGGPLNAKTVQRSRSVEAPRVVAIQPVGGVL